jgi:hypothetical protein
MDSRTVDEIARHLHQLPSIDERVKRVLESTPLFDTHNDLPSNRALASTVRCTTT